MMNVARTPNARHDRGEGFKPLDEPLVVAPNTAWRMLDCSASHGYALLNAGELQSFLPSDQGTVCDLHVELAGLMGRVGERASAALQKRDSFSACRSESR
jgi:hypothetical protein